jgi:hypothetical protein
MTQTSNGLYLRSSQPRARLLRLDAATILKRYYLCERSLVISQAGWIAGTTPFEVKMALARFLWEDALAADMLRERVFELRYPSRMLEIGEDKSLVVLFNEVINAPSAAAFILGLAQVLKPAMLAAYRDYLDEADELTDGPILRFLRLALAEKAGQIAQLTRFTGEMLSAIPPDRRQEALAWVSALSDSLIQLGAVSVKTPQTLAEPIKLPGQSDFQPAEIPARDPSFHLCHYYWPDIIDSNFAYGEGLRLQVRSAVSHLNEVWAVETGGAILQAFADTLAWEFIYDTARWTYDKSRHARMGFERLKAWGFTPADIPLGTYIYDSARGQPPIIRLGMLHYFETKNIGKKSKRAQAFASYQDKLSQHDMDFDWADETLHAAYGQRWHKQLHESSPDQFPALEDVRRRCDELIAAEVARATEAERAEIRRVAEAMLRKAERLAT